MWAVRNDQNGFRSINNESELNADETLSLAQPVLSVTRAQVIQRYSLEIQNNLDKFAKTRGYDNVNSSAKYKDITDEEISLLPEDVQSDVIRFRGECRYLALKTAETWARCYQILAEASNSNSIPSLTEVLEQLPTLEWPN